MKKLVTSLAFACATANALALPVTVDADDYSVGTNVSSPNNDVSIRAIHHHSDGTVDYRDMLVAPGPTYDLSGDSSEFGTNSFGFQRDNGTIHGWTMGVGNLEYFYAEGRAGAEYGAMTIQFFNPVRYLSVKGSFPSDPLAIRAYGANGALLYQAYGFFPRVDDCYYCYAGTMELSREQADIAYVIVGGSQGAGYINEFTYDVPAPASMVLLGIGLAFGTAVRTRKKLTRATSL